MRKVQKALLTATTKKVRNIHLSAFKKLLFLIRSAMPIHFTEFMFRISTGTGVRLQRKHAGVPVEQRI